MLVSQGADAALAGVFGLLIGSFLNVVIYRTPAMLHRDWLFDAVGHLMTQADGRSLWKRALGPSSTVEAALAKAADDAVPILDALPAFDLARPVSRCGHCGQPVRWYRNIPVLSYLVLGGRCGDCKARISPRYPIVELTVGLLFALCGWRFGFTPVGAMWAACASLLVCQFLIDLDTQLLPDLYNYLLLWLGLIGSALNWTGVPLASAVWGAVAGYLSLWLIYHAYLKITGKEGMGYGDFKLLAALGVWFGAEFLLAVVLVSSLVGAVVGGLLLLLGKLAHKDVPISFGPFLAGAGLVCLVAGPETVMAWLPFAFPFSH
jgi:leader peptidase (prepilin peptidase)/N-methyltransferase